MKTKIIKYLLEPTAMILGIKGTSRIEYVPRYEKILAYIITAIIVIPLIIIGYR